jgi:DNA-binding beta-propeller fold protein YncE
VAISGNNAYVYGGDVITVINTTTKTVTDSVALYNEPPAVSPDGTRRYVAGYMTVSVLNNQTGAVVDTIDIPNCDSCGYGYSSGLQELAISPDGTRVYARHAYALGIDTGAIPSAVTVINAANEVVGTAENLYLLDLEVAADGRVYAADQDYYYADVNVYDKDMRYLTSIRLSSLTGSSYSWPTTFAMSTDGKRAFAHVYDGNSGGMTVSVIDTDSQSLTYNTEIAMVTERYSAVSPDGSRSYVVEPDGKTITVYDTATNAEIGSFVTDNEANTTLRGIAVAPNGTLYIADPGDNKLYAVTML